MSGRTGTNADVINIARGGVKTALLSIPERNMHTQVEVVDLADIENTAKLIVGYILKKETELNPLKANDSMQNDEQNIDFEILM